MCLNHPPVMDMENIFINTATKNPIDVFFSGEHE
jgi:hypothetical protein